VQNSISQLQTQFRNSYNHRRSEKPKRQGDPKAGRYNKIRQISLYNPATLGELAMFAAQTHQKERPA